MRWSGCRPAGVRSGDRRIHGCPSYRFASSHVEVAVSVGKANDQQLNSQPGARNQAADVRQPVESSWQMKGQRTLSRHQNRPPGRRGLSGSRSAARQHKRVQPEGGTHAAVAGVSVERCRTKPSAIVWPSQPSPSAGKFDLATEKETSLNWHRRQSARRPAAAGGEAAPWRKFEGRRASHQSVDKASSQTQGFLTGRGSPPGV